MSSVASQVRLDIANPPAALGLICKRPNDRIWLRQLREWSAQQLKSQKWQVNPIIESLQSPEDALKWRAEMPSRRSVLAVGFTREEFANLQPISSSGTEPLLLVEQAGKSSKPEFPSASFLENRPVISCFDVLPQIRKSILRMALRLKVSICAPYSDTGLENYFALRYKVWKAAGFLQDSYKNSNVKWEIDYADRTAIPLVAVSTDGRTIGCTRLVRNLGCDQPYYVSRIETLLAQAADQTLTSQFNYPHLLVHPYDVLEEFPGFRSTFRRLMLQRVEVAEIGRVAVDPDERGQCLSEALVDTAISLAREASVSQLFLACHEVLAPLYQKCGFTPVETLRAAKFLNILLPSIIMQRLI